MATLQLVGTEWIGQEAARGAARGERATATEASARWRSELERAQWTLRGQRPASQAPGASSAELSPEIASARAAPRDASVPGKAEGAPAAAAREQASRSVSGSEIGAQRSAPPKDTVREPAGAEARVAAADRRASPRASLRSPLAPRFAGPAAWPRVNVHAYRGEEGIQVWVRDASLDEAARRKLAQDLRGRLGAGGERLGMLVVNGEAVLPAAPSAAENDDGSST